MQSGCAEGGWRVRCWPHERLPRPVAASSPADVLVPVESSLDRHESGMLATASLVPNAPINSVRKRRDTKVQNSIPICRLQPMKRLIRRRRLQQHSRRQKTKSFFVPRLPHMKAIPDIMHTRGTQAGARFRRPSSAAEIQTVVQQPVKAHPTPYQASRQAFRPQPDSEAYTAASRKRPSLVRL